MGGFVLIDRSTNSTVGAGMLHFELRRSQNVHWQALEIDKGAHSTLKGHRPAIVWFTGLSGSGKSSIANLVEKKLHSLGVHTSMLDGDNVRHGLSKDLGFTEPDRVENIRRVSEVAGLMVQAGLVVLVSFISPIATSGARRGSGWGRTSSARSSSTRRSRSPRSVTSKASTRRPVAATCASNFTGIDAPYEAPENPEVRIDTGIVDEAAAADLVVAELREMGVLDEDG